MPYAMRKKGDQWCVYNKDTGESKGCSDSREMATKHMRALYANAGDAKSKSMDPYDLYGAQYTQSEANYNPVGGDNEKACANCRWFSSPDGCLIVSGDVSPTGVSSLWAAVPEYTMEPIPVTVVKDIGGDDDEPSEEVILHEGINQDQQGIIQKAIETTLELFGFKAKQESGIKLKEEDDGRIRVFLPFTNNFMDRHGEIYARDAHKEYEQWADANGSYPELRLWHVPGSKWGQCDYVTFDETSGFGFASGLVDPGCEHIARSLAKSKDIGVSNSAWAIQKGNVVERYYCYEISPTPAKRAANIWHEGVKLLEDTMALPATKRAWLVEHAGEEFVTQIEKDYETRAAELAQSGVKSKDDGSATESGEGSGEPAPTGGITLEQLQSTLQAVVDPLVQRIDGLESKQGEISKSIDERAEEIFGKKLQEGYVASEKNKSDGEHDEEGASYEWLKDKRKAFALSGGTE